MALTAKTPPVAKPHPPTKTTPTTCKAVVRHSGGGNSAVTTTGKMSGGGNVGDKGRRSRKGGLWGEGGGACTGWLTLY